jgi:hypothetical protein
MTVTNAITGGVTGNAGTATKLAATKNINGVAFDGSADVVLPSTYWSIVTGDTSMAVNYGYIANKSSLVTFTLPSTAAVGTMVRVTGINTGGWKIAQNASGIIHFGNTDTTTGTGGYIASVNVRDSVQLVCVVANNEWQVVSSIGNITIA